MRLLSLDEALSTSEVRELHKTYLNSGLLQLMGLLHFDRVFDRALGCSVWDKDGNEYLDCLGGYGALNLGHNPLSVFRAIEKVSGRPNILQASLGELPAILAHNLAQVTPGKLQRTFFSNSGAEAVECALKMARAATGRQTIISLEGSFHGKTFGALSATGQRKYQEPFEPMVPGFETVPFGDQGVLNLLDRLRKGDVAAFIIEPILGEGGIQLHSPGYLLKVAEICRKYDVLLILDEIQTGLGRTGRLFAAEHEGIEPDIMCLAKSLGGGYIPIGVTIATDAVWQKAFGGMFNCLRHTSTFGGSALASAAGIAALEAIIELNLSRNAEAIGSYFLSEFHELARHYDFIREVRGQGLLIGIEFNVPKGWVGQQAYEFVGSMIAGALLNEHRIITAYTLNNPATVRIEPPLIITRGEAERCVEAVKQVLRKNSSNIRLALSSAGTMVRGAWDRLRRR